VQKTEAGAKATTGLKPAWVVSLDAALEAPLFHGTAGSTNRVKNQRRVLVLNLSGKTAVLKIAGKRIRA